MDDFDSKALKALMDTCRKAGVASFKGFGVEFTLADDKQQAPKRKRRAKVMTEHQMQQELSGAPDEGFESDSLSEDALLFYSVTDNNTEEKEQ